MILSIKLEITTKQIIYFQINEEIIEKTLPKTTKTIFAFIFQLKEDIFDDKKKQNKAYLFFFLLLVF